jgi:acrylyl-CoA reductase (NADPH)
MELMETFKALWTPSADRLPFWTTLPLSELPEGEVLVQVVYSGLNYKDALALTGKGKILRRYPIVPGIDLAGRVLESQVPSFRPGDQVLATGWGLGETHWGGYAELVRLPASWLIPLPEGLSLEQAMALGTAGLTAMLGLMALEDHGVLPPKDVVVTGATGGVGSLGIALLACRGYRVIAVTRQVEEAAYLKGLGAAEVVPHEELITERPLESERFPAALDAVGGKLLAGVLARMSRGGCVAACGNAGGAELPTTVYPFILRGVCLLGIDSAFAPRSLRLTAWNRLAQSFPLERLSEITRVVSWEELPDLAQMLVQGRHRGRWVLRVA